MEERKLKIDHFTHNHKLQLTIIDADEEELAHDSTCKMCTQTISKATPHYRCVDGCDFAIHVPCSEIPRYINHHFFHPGHSLYLSDESRSEEDNNNNNNNYHMCSVCLFDCSNSFIYKCSKCRFTMDIRCSLLVMFEENVPWVEHIRFGSPEHKYLFDCGMNKNYSYFCSCCTRVIDPGFRTVQVSIGWGILHIQCRTPPLKMNHPFHPSHGLLLEARPSERELACSACSERCMGYVYRCHKCRFALDFHCANLTLTTKANIVGPGGEAEEFSHPHPLIFCDVKQIFVFRQPCRMCRTPLMGSICYCPECNALMHRSCANVPWKIDRHHLHHPEHPLKMCEHGLIDGDLSGRHAPRCVACSGPCDGFFFECSECQWCIEARCALPKPKILMPAIHNHELIFFDEQNQGCRCQSCRQNCDTSFLSCSGCDFYIHVRCVSTFPPQIKYRGHVHPLTLMHAPVKYFPDEDETELCDACEKIRKVSHRSYVCEACHYAAHPHCVLTEVILGASLLMLAHSFLFLVAIPKFSLCVEHQIIQLLEEKPQFQESYVNDDEDDREPKMLSFKEFKDSFLAHDKAKIREIEGACRKYNRGDINYQKNFPLRLDEASEEILRRIVSEEAIVLPLSNWDDSSNLIKVGKYLTREDMETITRALFEKHGDFSSKSNVTLKVKMFYIMAICDVSHSMHETRVVDVATSQLASWYRCFLLGQYAGFEIKFVLDRLSKVVQAHFARMKDEATRRSETIFNSKGQKLTVADPDKDDAISRTKLTKDHEIEIMRRAISKLDGEIRDLEEALGKELKISTLMGEWAKDLKELEGQMAGDGILYSSEIVKSQPQTHSQQSQTQRRILFFLVLLLFLLFFLLFLALALFRLGTKQHRDGKD